MPLTPQEWESFLRLLVDRLNDYHDRGVFVDVMVFLGRTDRQTGEAKPPWVEVRERVSR